MSGILNLRKITLLSDRPSLLPEEVRFALVDGPYLAPDVREGQHIFCEMRGMVQVGGWTNAPIPWPRVKKTGAHSPILCGDLCRAVRTESAIAVAHWWGVNPVLVWKWRKALGVGKTEGTRRLWQGYKPQKLTEERAEKGREAAKTAESRAKRSATQTGRKAHEKTRKALLAAAQQPKSEDWKKQQALSMTRQWENCIRDRHPVWTAEKKAELTKLCEEGLTAREIAEIMGMTRFAILSARRRFGIVFSRF